MFQRMGKIYFGLLFGALMLLSSCGEYNRVLKSTDLDYKYAKAVEYYEAEQYNKAYPIFDELLTLYRGTAKAQDVYFYYSMTLFQQGDFILAAYHFKNFSKTFPNNKDADESAFMVAYCYYLESPSYSLDPSYTFKAINEFQLYINTHPRSTRIEECNLMMDELRSRLERKSYEIARQYYRTGHYQSAVVSFTNTLNTYPDTKYREEALYLKFDAAFRLAKNSVKDKQEQRLIEARTAVREYMDQYPEGEYVKTANNTLTDIAEYISELNKINSES